MQSVLINMYLRKDHAKSGKFSPQETGSAADNVFLFTLYTLIPCMLFGILYTVLPGVWFSPKFF